MVRTVRRGGSGARAAVHRITGARRSLTEDVRSRQTRYIVSMGVRTVCFVLAVVTNGWWRGIFFAAAVVLPYFSVVFANAGREQAGEPPELVAPLTHLEIGPGPDAVRPLRD